MTSKQCEVMNIPYIEVTSDGEKKKSSTIYSKGWSNCVIWVATGSLWEHCQARTSVTELNSCAI